MPEQPTYEELQRHIAQLEKEAVQRLRFEKINTALFTIANAVNITSDLDELYKSIHLALGAILDTTNFFLALYDKDRDCVTFPYIVDTVDLYYPPVIEISKTASLTAEVIKTGAPLMVNKAEIIKRQYGGVLRPPACTPAEIWLGVPLRIRRHIVGVMAVQNYERPDCYDQTDINVMVAVADQVAIALQSKQAERSLQLSEIRFRRLLNEVPSIAVQGYASDGTTRFWNKASAKLYGYTTEEAVGKNLIDLIIPPEMYDNFHQGMQYMAETGLPVPASELSLLHKDGSRVEVFSSHAIVEIPGQQQELFCIDIDIGGRKIAEEALRSSVAHLQSIFRAAPIGIGVVADRVILQVNERICRLTGYSLNELIGQNARMLYADEATYLNVGREKYRQIAAHGTGTVETSWQHKDGTIIDILLSSTPFDPANLEAGVTFTALDITARKKTEKALHKRKRFFRALFENAGDAIFIEDVHDRIIDVNRRACDLLGYTREELLTMYVPDLQAPECRGTQGSTIRNELTNHNGLPFETVDIGKDGRHIPVEVTTVALTEGEDNLALSIVRDITERKRAEADRERLMQAIEQSAETIVITDPQGIIQYANPAFASVSGYSVEEAVGRNTRILRSGKHDDAFYSAIFDTVSKGNTWKGQITNTRKDGSFYTEAATISPVFGTDGRVAHHIAVKLDITEQLKTEQEKAVLEKQILQARKMSAVGRLAGGVAHDFNNMLTVILGYTELCLQNAKANPSLTENLEVILHAAGKSSDIVRQLLAFARQQSVVPKVINLSDIVESMLKILRRLIGEDIELLWLPAKDNWLVKIDPSQIDQILANLCANARDAVKDVGIITIETSTVSFDADYCASHENFAPGDFMVLAVSDNGCGMSEELLDHVFEPFFTTKGMGQGTGLGLATVYGIVKQNDGYIDIHSEPARGTSVKIFLHRYKEDDSRPTTIEVKTVSAGCGETILLVEDAPELLQMCRHMLERLGYKVLSAATPREALQLAENTGDMIKLLLTDIIMPGMNGRELATKLAIASPQLRVLFMSGYTADVIAHHGVLDGGVNFIQKPFTIKELAVKVREAM